MTHRRNQNIGTDGTLDRLNDALSALENRITGAARVPEAGRRRPVDDVAMIREREAALRAQSASTQSFSQSAAEFDVLRDEIRSIQGASANTGTGIRELRSDIDALKSAVTLLAKQDTIDELADRWGVVEREIARMPETLASRDDIAGMVARLDGLGDAISSMPQDRETRALEERIQTLAAAMEAFGAQQAGFEKSFFDGMHDRFSAIDRAIDNVALQSGGGVNDSLDRIEARIASVTRQIDELQTGSERDYSPQFADMIDRLDALQAVGGGDPAVHEALTLIAERVADLQMAPVHTNGVADREIAELSGRLDQIVDLLNTSQSPQSAPLGEQALGDIESRLDALTEQLSLSAETTGRSVDQAVAALENRIGDLARAFDERPAEAPAGTPLASLEERLDDIARFLTQNADSPEGTGAGPALDTQVLEMQIAELSARLADTSDNLAAVPAYSQEGGSGIDVMQAARSAAEEVLKQAELNGVSAPDFERLSADLKSLEALARETDGRNERTFEAIHDTLLKIVDHLSDIESKASVSPVVAQVDTAPGQSKPTQGYAGPDDGFAGYQEPLSSDTMMPAIPSQAGLDAMPPTDRMPIDDAPSIDGSGNEPMAPDLTPAQAAASAAIAAMSQSGIESAREEPQSDTKRSIFAAVTSRLRGNERTEPQVTAPNYDGAQADTPLEPDTAQAEVAEIIARVRRERESGQSTSNIPTPNEPATVVKAEGTSSKSDFIAAARRAAQAAASDAQAAETKTSSKTDGLKSSVSKLVAQRKRPILIGAAAILVAMLALPFVRGMLGGGQEVADLAPPPQPPAIEQNIETANDLTLVEPAAVQAEADEAVVVENIELADPVPAPRVVAIDPAPETADAELDLLAETTETTAPQVVVDPTPVAAVPTDAGTPALQDAARSGDATAMFLIGDYFAAKAQTDGPASAEQNNRDALAWYTKSAEDGYAPAQQRVGSLYEKGIGADRDFALAKSWYQLAADQGNSAAMHNLAVLYANGVDGQPELSQAVRWFEEAALLGVPDSQYNLGVMAVRGDGMEPSLRDSYKWFALAAQSGDSDAAAKRDTVAERMDPETLKLAQDEVALWRARPLDQTANIVTVPDAWQTDQMRTAAAPPSAPIDMKKAVGNIQAILNNNGYDAGPVDGLMGEKTRQAIKAFQTDNGIAPTGEVNEELVRKLLELTS
ncbi:MAG: peptidoglycan-binding protein [Pseudomonadota bacterium]